jgi:hypothetical protein
MISQSEIEMKDDMTEYVTPSSNSDSLCVLF